MIVLHWWHLISGLSTLLLEHIKPIIQYTEHHWFTSIQVFLHNLQGKLIIPDIQKERPSFLRVNNKAVMGAVSTSDFTTTEQENVIA